MPTKPKKRFFIEEDFNTKLLKDIHENQVLDITKILPLVTPGTELRKGLDEILHGNLGGLIVLGDSEKLNPILKGGIDLDIPFSSQKLFELSKMDGAIILSNDLTKIVGANKHLMPDRNVPSKETGMRHRSAEQTAIASELPVIAISHRRSVISLYYRDQKYVLQDFNTLMVKASYAINNLKDFRAKLDKRLKNLSFCEVYKPSHLKEEIIETVQNILYFYKHEKQLDDLIIELGSQGQDISNTLYEVIFGLDEELSMIIRDYNNHSFITKQESYEKLSYLKQIGIRRISDVEKLIEISEFSKFIENPNDFPRGFRFFSKLDFLDENIIDSIVKNYSSLKNIKNLTSQDFSKIPGIDSNISKKIFNHINNIYNKKI